MNIACDNGRLAAYRGGVEVAHAAHYAGVWSVWRTGKRDAYGRVRTRNEAVELLHTLAQR